MTEMLRPVTRLATLAALAMLAPALLAPVLAVAQDQRAQKPPPPEPMRIAVVRDAGPGCEPGCREWIAAQGGVVKGSLEELRRTIGGLQGRKLPVMLYSVGGDVATAIAMGELIRRSGLDVAVARTVFAEGEPGRGTLDERSPLCSSACTFVLAGGVRRIIPTQSRIGVHQQTIVETETTTVRDYQIVRRREGDRIVERRELVKETKEQRTVRQELATGEVDEKIARHFDAMGLDRSFLTMTVQTPADTMRYLTPAEMTATTIATRVAPASAAFARPHPLPPARQRSGEAPPAGTAPDAAPVRAAALSGEVPAQVPAQVLGHVPFGEYRGRPLALELAAQRLDDPQVVALGLRLLFDGTPLSTRLRTVTFGLPDQPPLVADNLDAAAPEGPMVARLGRDLVCRIGDRAQVLVRIDPPEEDAGRERWLRTGPAAELLLAPALRRAVC